MSKLNILQSALRNLAERPSPAKAVFYKTGPGEYAEHDKFIGVNVPTLRKLAQEYKKLSLDDLQSLLESPINEERLLALLILVKQYEHGAQQDRETIYQFYINNLKYVNNWNLVDASAHLILGAHLLKQERDILFSLAGSSVMWERRIAIVATWMLIRNNDYEWTIKISELLLQDTCDLIHKAVGWMLREVGKRDINILIRFLDQHSQYMPRTMLRYAIEQFPQEKRKGYLIRIGI